MRFSRAWRFEHFPARCRGLWKKIIPLALVFFMAASFSACRGQEEAAPGKNLEDLGIEVASASLQARLGYASSWAGFLETPCEKNPDIFSTGVTDLIEYEAAEAPEGRGTPEGMVWKRLRVPILFSDEAANQYGFTFNYFMTDFYDMDGFAGNLSGTDKDGFERFAVSWEGHKYQCAARVQKSISDWEAAQDGLRRCEAAVEWLFCVPKGYDGLCFGVCSAGLDWPKSASSLENVLPDPSSYILFRAD